MRWWFRSALGKDVGGSYWRDNTIWLACNWEISTNSDARTGWYWCDAHGYDFDIGCLITMYWWERTAAWHNTGYCGSIKAFAWMHNGKNYTSIADASGGLNDWAGAAWIIGDDLVG